MNGLDQFIRNLETAAKQAKQLEDSLREKKKDLPHTPYEKLALRIRDIADACPNEEWQDDIYSAANLLMEIPPVTKEAQIIISAYTGILMCDFKDMHEYIEEKLGRRVWVHELADPNVQKEIKEAVKSDFLYLCEK